MTVLGGLQCHLTRTSRVRPVVSIPMTVLGGLQFEDVQSLRELISEVSIPMTVLGGLQFLNSLLPSLETEFQYR